MSSVKSKILKNNHDAAPPAPQVVSGEEGEVIDNVIRNEKPLVRAVIGIVTRCRDSACQTMNSIAYMMKSVDPAGIEPASPEYQSGVLTIRRWARGSTKPA